MILLLGGTSETREIALALARTGAKVLASTATDNELDVGTHENITRRKGRMNEDEMASLIREKGVDLLIDASHPFAVAAHETARKAAERAGVRHIRFQRPESAYDNDGVIFVDDHESAARSAFSFGKPVLLTTGSRNLQPYVAESKRTGLPLIARVLPHAESLEACKNAGLPDSAVITGRGPFSEEENIEVINKFGVGVLVTKDSGREGGVPEKISAAKRASCKVVVVRRPERDLKGVSTVEQLLAEVASNIEAAGSGRCEFIRTKEAQDG